MACKNWSTAALASIGIALLSALVPTIPGAAKDCVQLTGGACKGHWACTTSDGSSGFCTDGAATDCYCKKGPKTKTHRRITEDNPAYMENTPSHVTKPTAAHHDDSNYPNGYPPYGPMHDDKEHHGTNPGNPYGSDMPGDSPSQGPH